MPAYTARPVTPADLPLISGFAESAETLFYFFPKAHFPLDAAQLASALAERQHGTVLLSGEQPVAYANLLKVIPGEYASLGNLVVSPAARGQGAARALIEHLEHLARTNFAIRELRAACFNHNSAGLLCYQQLGFSPFAMEPRQDWQSRAVMLLHLRRAIPC